jgi:hypothetical protein
MNYDVTVTMTAGSPSPATRMIESGIRVTVMMIRVRSLVVIQSTDPSLILIPSDATAHDHCPG